MPLQLNLGVRHHLSFPFRIDRSYILSMPFSLADIRALPEWVKLVVLPLAGALAKLVWDRYRGRLAPLRWTATYQAMAFATEDIGWGKVEILYDGSHAQNLHMAYVQLQNASSRDLANLRIDLLAGDGTVALRSAGMLRGGTNAFPFADEYAHVLQLSADGKLSEVDRASWLRRSSFIIPVLNRGAVADFKLLVARFDYATPVVSLSVEHSGVRVLHQPPAKEIWGVRDGPAVLVGVLAGLSASYAILQYGVRAGIVVGIAWFLGAVAQHVGAATVRLWRAVTALVE